jgi:hypothetical protein
MLLSEEGTLSLNTLIFIIIFIIAIAVFSASCFRRFLNHPRQTENRSDNILKRLERDNLSVGSVRLS